MTLKFLWAGGEFSCRARPGQSILEVLRGGGEDRLHAPCGGKGTCGKCTVYLQREGGEQAVLACRTPAEDGMTVRLPERGAVTVELGGEQPLPPDPGQRGYGVACDIGTTTVVCRLIDLSSGRCLGETGAANAQSLYGADVISRIQSWSEGKGGEMTRAIVGQLDGAVRGLCARAGVPSEQVGLISVAANTTMCHILTGLSPEGMGAAPFTPLSRFGAEYSARDLGMSFDARVYIAPACSGYVGGDVTADLLAQQLDLAREPVLLIDVGTNGEMALGCGQHFTCCAAAAGPAFEGAQISCGMTAAPGAVSAVEWGEEGLRCTVIGGGEATGICGSGLIDAVAVMLELGAVDETGRMLDVEEDDIPPRLQSCLTLLEGSPAFCLAPGVWVTQQDVRRVQLGKGAIAAGIRVLLDSTGTRPEQVQALLLAGGFGSFIRPGSAARIGLIPRELLPVTRAVGNAAVRGAGMALVSARARERLDGLRDGMDYIELSGLPAFNEAYIEEMLFPEEDD